MLKIVRDEPEEIYAIYRGWPLKKWKNGGYVTLHKWVPTIEEVDEIYREEPDFILPWNYNKGIDDITSTEIGEKAANVGAIVPTLPEAAEYLSENRPVPPDKALPGIHCGKSVYFIEGFFRLESPTKTINNRIPEIREKYILYKDVLFKEAVVDVKLPWKYVKDDISSVTLNDIDKKHYTVKRKLPFDQWTDIKHIVTENNFDPKRDRLEFFGWGEDYAFAVRILYNGYDFVYINKPPNNPYSDDEKEFFGLWPVKAKHYRTRGSEIFREFESGEELIEFLEF